MRRTKMKNNIFIQFYSRSWWFLARPKSNLLTKFYKKQFCSFWELLWDAHRQTEAKNTSLILVNSAKEKQRLDRGRGEENIQRQREMETEFREKHFSIRCEIGTHEAGRETFLICLFASNAAISQWGSSVLVHMCPCLFIPSQRYLFITSSAAVSLPCTRSQPWSPLTVRSIRLPPPYHFCRCLHMPSSPHTHIHPNTILNGSSHSMQKKKKIYHMQNNMSRITERKIHSPRTAIDVVSLSWEALLEYDWYNAGLTDILRTFAF